MATRSGELTLGDFEISMADMLGKGTFGVVYGGKNLKDDTIVAAKQCKIETDEQGAMAMKEIKNFQQLLDHPNIVQMLDFHYYNKFIWIIMEYCDEGDLQSFMRRTKPADDVRINIMYQCANGLNFMHTRPKPVIHRDVKPANIMMKRIPKSTTVVVKITDFGLSKIIDIDPNKTMLFTTAAGTPGFMAPEFFMSEPYSKSVDIFALGLVFLTVFNFKHKDKDMIPVACQGPGPNIILPIGMQMVNMKMLNKPMPLLVMQQANDTMNAKILKEIIIGMTAYESKERMPLQEVLRKLQTIGGSTPGYVAPRSVQTRLMENSEHSPRIQPQMTSTSRVLMSVAEDCEEECGEVGYEMLKEVLEQALLDMDSDLKPSRIRGVPFTSLLGLVLGDKRAIDNFEVGDKVIVSRNMDEAIELQRGHGEWNDAMKHYLGREGTIKAKVFHVLRVQFPDGQCWNYNPQLLNKPGERSNSEPPPYEDTKRLQVVGLFKRYDIVKLPDDEELVKCLQKGHGGWNEKMKHCLGIKGIVNRIDRDGDIYVECINGDNWTFNPEMLIHEDMSKETIEAGDFVIVKDDRDVVKDLQQNNGGWIESMSHALGKSGIVQLVSGCRARVESKNRSYVWNIDALVLVAKGEEMLKALLKKK